jgi:hypothetical protein
LDAGKETERGAAEVGWGVGGDGGVFGGLDAADADPGEEEPGKQRDPGGGVSGEAEVGV